MSIKSRMRGVPRGYAPAAWKTAMGLRDPTTEDWSIYGGALGQRGATAFSS